MRNWFEGLVRMPGLESVKTCHWCARLVRNKSAHSGGKKYAQVVRNHRAYFTQSAHFSRNSFTQSGCAKPPGDTVDEQPRRTSQTLPRPGVVPMNAATSNPYRMSATTYAVVPRHDPGRPANVATFMLLAAVSSTAVYRLGQSLGREPSDQSRQRLNLSRMILQIILKCWRSCAAKGYAAELNPMRG